MASSALLEKSPQLIAPVIGTGVIWLLFAWVFPSEPLDAKDTAFVFAACAAVTAVAWSVGRKVRAYFSRRHRPAGSGATPSPAAAGSRGKATRLTAGPFKELAVRLAKNTWTWLGAIALGAALGTMLLHAVPDVSALLFNAERGRPSPIIPEPVPHGSPLPPPQPAAAPQSMPDIPSVAVPMPQMPAVAMQSLNPAEPPIPEDAVRGAPTRYTLRGLLTSTEVERPGFALYSYLLFDRDTPDGINRERREAAILGLITEVDPLEVQERLGLADAEVNAFYLPVLNRPPADLGRDQSGLIGQLLTQYDFPRARLMIDRLRLTGDGPFIVAVMRPLSDPAGIDRNRLLVHDLSGVPPRLIPLWIREFRRQAAQAQFWNRDLRQLALNARTAITRMAEAFQVVREAQDAITVEPSL